MNIDVKETNSNKPQMCRNRIWPTYVHKRSETLIATLPDVLKQGVAGFQFHKSIPSFLYFVFCFFLSSLLFFSCFSSPILVFFLLSILGNLDINFIFNLVLLKKYCLFNFSHLESFIILKLISGGR
uniref:Uncharacterized protein n=1 Tax=Cacopsylla melanoneura TaxID=428564 RepID=A0A8D8SZR3_9HEMI